MSVDVRIGILGLAVLRQHFWGDLEELADEFEQRIVREVAEGELALGEVAGVCFAQDGVAVAGEDLAIFERRPEVVCYGFVAKVAGDGFLRFEEPVERLLVC